MGISSDGADLRADPPPVSLFVIALNEGDRIEAAIASARGVVSEIVVVDSGSEDDTVARAEAAGAIVRHNPWSGYGAQKRFAEELCSHPWVLNLDADERLDANLARSIPRLFETGEPPAPGYRIAIKDCYPHQSAPGRFARTYRPVRLYDKRRARYRDHPYLDRVELDERAAPLLDGAIVHHSIRSLRHLADKLDRYYQAQFFSSEKRIGALRLAAEWPASFLKSYVLRGHVFGGAYGFAVAGIYASARFKRAALLWARGRFGEKESETR